MVKTLEFRIERIGSYRSYDKSSRFESKKDTKVDFLMIKIFTDYKTNTRLYLIRTLILIPLSSIYRDT